MKELTQSNKKISIESSFKKSTLSVLSQKKITFMQLTQAVNELEKKEQNRVIKMGVSSSVTVDLLNIYIRKEGLLNGTKIDLVAGNYDDPVGDIDLFKEAGVEQIVLLPFFDSLIPSFEAQLNCLASSIIDTKEVEIRQRYRMVFEKASSFSAIYLGTFHRISPAAKATGLDPVAVVVERFNIALKEEAARYKNIHLINTEDIIHTIGLSSAIDLRFYFSSMAPYTTAFMNELALRITKITRGFGSHFYKVLALDCDNTLWGGVIGEDLLHGIKLGPHDYPGNVFWRMQQEFAALENQGILLALITKNNQADIEEVLHKHPNMVLKESQFVVKKINWEDKPANLRSLAKELNIGLDSIIFLDDSSFECEAVRQQLPMVKTMQVPVMLSDYQSVVNEIKSLCLGGGINSDSKNKTMQYRQRADAEEIKAQFGSQEEYLLSLEIKVELTCNKRTSVDRISELSKKSNQFNLTTRRYSVAEIEQMIESDKNAIYSMVVNDKFGSAGLTGVALIHYEETIATVQNFFMSCRVIGRSVETCIWNSIVADALQRGCSELRAEFIPSTKNSQVKDFYTHLGMRLYEQATDGTKKYVIKTADYINIVKPWIQVTYVK
jgi:FkbH-like protein